MREHVRIISPLSRSFIDDIVLLSVVALCGFHNLSMVTGFVCFPSPGFDIKNSMTGATLL